MLDTKLVHVLVHRESEEYNTSDVEDSPAGKVDIRRPPEIKISPGSDDQSSTGLVPESIVKIMVESPKDPPQVDYTYTFPAATEGAGTSGDAAEESAVRIDVTVPVDSTNIFYEYEEPKKKEDKQS